MGQDVSSSNSSLGSPATPVMSQGEGENSYAKNSQMQGTFMQKLLPIFFDAIKSVTLPDPDNAFRIADLGCSSSLNTIVNVETVIEQVRARYREEGMGDSAPEIQVFFQDLPSNDFNTLFRHLFSQPNSEVEKGQNYMSAAVPGSFCDRLFPKSTIDIVMSSFALHWVSKIPDAVRDRQSPAYNGGHTDICHSSLATVQAYAEQAEKDLDNFLSARAHEVTPGGLIFLIFGIRRTEFFPYRWEVGLHLQEEVWNGLVLEGSVSEELRDSYNIPLYFRTLEEVKKALEKYSSIFEVQKHEVIPWNYDAWFHKNVDPTEIARLRVRLGRGTSADFLEAYFGKAATNMLYERWEQALCVQFTRWQSGTIRERDFKSPAMLALGLRRK